MIRHLALGGSLLIGVLGAGTAAYADCALIDQLDKSIAIQTRLANNPDTALFPSDVRQIRVFLKGISDRTALNAIDGNRFNAEGATVVQFLASSQHLLQRASLDDPNSVRPHFNQHVRENLAKMRAFLPAWRCASEQIEIAVATAARRGGASLSDEEELERVAETLNTLADEVLRLRTLVILLLGTIAVSIASPIISRYLLLRRRRAKRHNCTYPTQYTLDDKAFDAMLVDINCHGTKLRHDTEAPPPKGSLVVVTICDESVEGSVMWANTHYSGVQFQKLIPLAFIDPVRAADPAPQKQNGAPRGAALPNQT